MHDHTPHHGGVVGMSGETHLEALIEPDGRVRVWVTDFWRRPRGIDDVRGRVTLELAEGDRTVPFRAAGDALEAAAGPLDVPEVPARVVLDVGGTAVDMDFLLPVAGSDPGAASVPLRGCVPVPAAPDGLRPRCVLEFPRAVSALAATPDGALVLVAGVDLGVTAWQLPEGSFLRGFAAAPPLAVPATDARPHSEAANAIAIRPDGTEAVVAVEGRLLRYAVTSGRLLRELPAQAGVVRAVAWSRDGRRLLASVFYDPTAHVLAADDGALLARLPVEREAAAVAFSADGTLAAVGNELGSIVLFDLASLAPLRELRGGRSPVSAVALANDRVVSAAGDGVLRVWDAGSGRLAHETAPGPMLAALAIARSGERAAAAGYDGVLRVVDLRTQAMERLAWHDAPVHALAWAGETLVSGDGRGRVALWDVR
jgi:WD40 repeat protein